MDRWRNRVALVTGASSGIGAGICRELVKHGMHVVGCARSEDVLRRIAEEDCIKKSNGKFMPIRCDLNQESEILSMFDSIQRTFGRLDVCINSAGLSHDSSLLSGETPDWQNMLNVNVLALSICTREAVRLMRERTDDGQIIHINGMSGHKLLNNGLPGFNFYCGTKFMVRALAEGLRRELKENNTRIRISCISPGLVKTYFLDHFYKNNPFRSGEDHFKRLQPLEPQDIADSVVYILSSPPHVELHDILVRSTEQK